MQVLHTTLLCYYDNSDLLRTVPPNFDVPCTFALAKLVNFQNVRALGQEYSAMFIFA